MVFLHVLLFAFVGLSLAQQDTEPGVADPRNYCGPCDDSACPTDLSCPAERVPDRCGCCNVCAKVLGDRCGGPDSGDGRCSEEYICAGESVYEPVKGGKVGQCVCRSFETVCGTDGVVYKNKCELRMAASNERVEKGKSTIDVDETDGMCLTSPIISVAPKDSILELDTQSELSCEAIGRPTPDIIWTKEGGDSEEEVLPGNHINIATRKRNGPTKFGMTSWVLMTVSSEDSGTYRCTAKNSQGVVTSSAEIIIAQEDVVRQDQNVNDVPIQL